MAVGAPELQSVLDHMPGVFAMLSRMSLQSTLSLLPDGINPDAFLSDYVKHLDNINAVVEVTQDRLNPRFNKTYGTGGTTWTGPLDDGQPRGDIPYFCPSGWARFSLKVCPAGEFDKNYGDCGYLYHGTNSKHVGSILSSGFRASQGLCFCGKDESAVYLSPSIEYSGHPRYSCIEYNPETRMWFQCVLQCRVRPSAVWKKAGETMRCAEYGLTCDQHIPNSDMEWLFKPNFFDEDSGCYFLKDAVICTGIMVRLTDQHPCKLDYWWSQSHAYLTSWALQFPVVDPSPPAQHTWSRIRCVQQHTYSARELVDVLDLNFDSVSDEKSLGSCEIALRPFAAGGMRYAYHLRTSEGRMFVLKRFNAETLRHITEGLGITEEQAVMKDVHTYLAAGHLATCWNSSLPSEWRKPCNFIRFLTPMVFKFSDEHGRAHTVFGEELVDGNFIKWNSNAGYVNVEECAMSCNADLLIGTFCHFTYQHTQGRAMVVDMQGWNTGGSDDRHMLFTDPQIHTHKEMPGTSRRSDLWFRRFSMGNLGKVGMVRFFRGHQCTPLGCRCLGLRPVSVKTLTGDQVRNQPQQALYRHVSRFA